MKHSQAMTAESGDLMEVFDDLLELTETTRNACTNLCHLGGLPPLFEIACAHPDAAARKRACSLLCSLTGNNKAVQEFAMRSGAINLAIQLEREPVPMVVEGVLGALLSLLKADNFPGKVRYIADPDIQGLQ